MMRFRIEEPIEIRMAIVPKFANGEEGEPLARTAKTLFAENVGGSIRVSLSRDGGPPESLSNLQSRGNKHLPRKAVEGWQDQLLDWAEDCLYRVLEVR